MMSARTFVFLAAIKEVASRGCRGRLRAGMGGGGKIQPFMKAVSEQCHGKSASQDIWDTAFAQELF